MADLSQDELLALIQKNHPDLWVLMDKPGIRDLALQIVQAEASGSPWTDQQIRDGFQATEYYRTNSQTARDFDIITATDPARAQQLGDQMTQHVLHIAQTLGIQLTPENQWDIVVSGLHQGWGDAEIQHALLFGAAFTGLQVSGTGDVAGAALNVKSLASDYGVPMGDQAAMQWALGVKDGVVTSDSLKAYMTEQAKSLYPGLAAALDSGITVRQYADPYAQVAAKELGINPNDFNLADTKWSAPLQQIDPKTGDRTAMTLAAWTSKVRSDPTYGYDTTTGARDQAAQFATNLAQQFGAIG